MLRRILTATDFSPAARRAVQRAALLAKQSGAKLTVLHVLPERGAIERVLHRHELDYAQMTVGAERSLQNEVEAIHTAHGVVAEPTVLEGVSHDAIASAGKALKADLVVIGARGESENPFITRTLGETALKCLRRMTLPLLLVCREIEGHYYKILAAVDGSTSSDRVLERALEMSPDGAICHVVHVFDAPFASRLRAHNIPEEAVEAYAAEEQKRSEQEIAALLAQHSATGRAKPIVVRGSVAATLAREISLWQPDLVVLGRHSPRELIGSPDTIGGAAMRVAFHASADVLVTT